MGYEKGRPNDLCMVLRHGTHHRGNEIRGKVRSDDSQPRGHLEFPGSTGLDQDKGGLRHRGGKGGEDRNAGDGANVEGERYGKGEDVERCWTDLERVFEEYRGRRRAEDKSVRR